MKSLIATTVFILAVSAFAQTNVKAPPLRRSEQDIRNWLLAQAPLGSSAKDVKALIEAQHWNKYFEWRGPLSRTSKKDYPFVKGTHIVGAFLGGYWGFPFHMVVRAHWGFSKEGKLTDVNVEKWGEGF